MKKSLLFIISASIILMISCNAKLLQVDLIIINGTIYTVDDSMQVVEAMAVNNGKIIATGSNKEMLSAYSSDQVIDAEGGFIYPGFYDAHCHFYHYGTGLIRRADLRGQTSFESVVKVMEAFAEKRPDGWLAGRGWDQNLWQIKDLPDNKLLNRAFPDRPVVLSRIDGHAVVVNDVALKYAGITINTTIEGGEVVVVDGKLTGLLIDKAADLLNDYYYKAMTSESDNRQEVVEGILMAQQRCFSVGLTSVADAGLEVDEVTLLDSLDKAGALKIKVYAMLSFTADNIEKYISKGPYKTEHLYLKAVKFFADGALGSRGALLKEPYSDKEGHYGLLVTNEEELEQNFIDVYNYGFQVCTHAIGDSANKMILELYGKVLREKNDFRWRIEHSQVVSSEDIDIFGEFNIIPSVNTTHATSDMYWADERLGERLVDGYAYHNLLQQNGWLPNGSDFPVEQINPLLGFYAGVVRKDVSGFPEAGFQIENRLTRVEALRAMTIWAAKASFEEEEKGSLEPGKAADFVILDNDIMTCKPHEIPKTKTIETWINGEKVFGK